MSKNERRLLATTRQVEAIADGIETLAGDGLIPWLENRDKDMTMEHTYRWLQFEGHTHQAHTLQINTPEYEQIRWRLDKFRSLGTHAIDVVQRSEILVGKYEAVDPQMKMRYPRNQHPTILTMHDGEKVLSTQRRYFGRAGDLLAADEANLYFALQNTASTAGAKFDRFLFEDILYAAGNSTEGRMISMFGSDIESVSVFGAIRALRTIRRLQRSASFIEKPTDLPD